MFNDRNENLFKFNKDLLGPFSEWHKAASDICQKALKQHMDLAGENFNLVSDQLKRLSNVKKPEDLIELQKECMQENMKAAVKTMEEMVHQSMENMEEFKKICSAAHEKVTPVVKEKFHEREKEKHGK